MQKAYLYKPGNAFPSVTFDQYLLIGSDPSAGLSIPGLADRHAKIEKTGSHYSLKDLRSELGTYFNDQRVQEVNLSEGDWLRFADQEWMFSFQSEKQQKTLSLSSKNADWNQQLLNLGRAAQTEFPILLLGPSGAGKEVLAQEIHQISSRYDKALVCVNCSALSENLIESELFGHVKGSFTGALTDRKGAFESARGGTLFLDEIGDLPMSLQAKLLRALENNEIRPVGSDTTVKTNVRVLAATHHDLLTKIKTGEFRADLYYRLNVVSVKAPSLFERPEDFDEILMSFAKKWKVRFEFAAIQRLRKHTWPGNIRELKNTVARASAFYGRQSVTAEMVETVLDKTLLDGNNMPITDGSSVNLPFIKEVERQLIIKRLSINRGNQRKTASDLGMPKSTLHDRLRVYKIDPKTFEV